MSGAGAEMPKAVLITGPTASGKTSFAVKLARKFGGEIVGADSRQVYKRLDVGSGKDMAEYSSGGAPVACHLVDVAEPDSEFNLAEYLNAASAALWDVSRRGALPILAGGSPLYVDAVLKGYELPGGPSDKSLRDRLCDLPPEELAKMLPPGEALPLKDGEDSNWLRLLRRLELSSTRREGSGEPERPFRANWLALGVRVERAELRLRIARRLDERLAAGMVEEVAKLHESGVSWERLERFGLEYRHVALHLQGRATLQETRDALFIKICQFAKRQDTWFRKMEREGLEIHWFRPEAFEEAAALTDAFLRGSSLPKPAFRLCNP